jgi:hypothetical protein
MRTGIHRLFLWPIACLSVFSSAASGVNLAISIGVRETGTSAPIGADGGVANSIEWVNRDGLLLPLDGAFHTFTFNFGTDPVAYFFGTQPAGGQPNRLDGTRGTLEHIRIRNTNGITVPVQLYIDNIRNATALAGPVTVSNFEGVPVGSEVTFQDPLFSGSTSANLAPSPNVAAVTGPIASEGAQSDGIQFRFIDADNTRWLRLTTNIATNLPNPAIDFAPGSALSFDVRGVLLPEPTAIIWMPFVFAALSFRATHAFPAARRC